MLLLCNPPHLVHTLRELKKEEYQVNVSTYCDFEYT